MSIFDAHIHCEPGIATPKTCIERMQKIGICGGGILSPEPENFRRGTGYSYEVRMDTLSAWTDGYQERLFPILWIHPFEENAISKARDAVSRGVVAFKMICEDYYVYDDTCMELLHEIARLEKPVMFHSGILWDGYDSSKYNRPLNWEALITIPKLRFSLAHCAYPWYDECIAMYGKFLNAYATNPDTSAELFLDLTPGTPAIYRKDLIYKLLHAGYDTPHNILFGTDCTINDYHTDWAETWIHRDSAIFHEAGASSRLLELYFKENFMRFLGFVPKNFKHVVPVPDRADAWSLKYANQNL